MSPEASARPPSRPPGRLYASENQVLRNLIWTLPPTGKAALHRSICRSETTGVIPETRYATTSDGLSIAYQVFGEGTVDLLLIPAWVSHLEVAWENPLFARFMERLGSFSRVITFDKRGTGLSSRLTRIPDLETRLDDARAVLDAVGSEGVAVLGDGSDGLGLGALHAATYPARTTALVLWGPAAKIEWTPEYPWGTTEEEFGREQDEIRKGWGTDAWAVGFAGLDAPTVLEHPELIPGYAKYFRYSATPTDALLFNELWFATDVRDLLSVVNVPTLVLARSGPAGADWAAEAQYVAERIPRARLVLMDGEDFPKWLGNQDAVVREVREFITGVREEPEPNRVLATLLFTDIVRSTERAVELGDRAWRIVVEQHNETVRDLLAIFHGEEVDTAGDGFFATFDGPARAVRCALAIHTAVRPLGVELRAGVHTGEIETGGGKPRGIAVVIGARVAATADQGEVLVSSTVKDLVAGSGLLFQDRGEHKLKGVPNRWRLYHAAAE
jgi:class 3 adenylate cyclase